MMSSLVSQPGFVRVAQFLKRNTAITLFPVSILSKSLIAFVGSIARGLHRKGKDGFRNKHVQYKVTAF